MSEKQEIQAMISKEDFKEIAKIGRKYLGVAGHLDDVDAVFNVECICASLPAAIADAIEYGRATADESTTTRPVMTTAESGKKFPITEAHVAAIEFEEVLDEAVSWYRVRKPEDASHPSQVALSDMLNNLLNQTLVIRVQLARLAKAEK